MSAKRLAIIGAGGHGKVAGDCARATGAWEEVVHFDDRWPDLQACGKSAVVGAADAVLGALDASTEVFVAIGGTDARMRWIRRLTDAGAPIATIVHPSAVVSSDTVVDVGVLVVASAVVNAGTRIGRGVIVNTNCSVDHDCSIGDGVHICPGVTIAGDVAIGEDSWIGVGAVVSNGVRIGTGTTIGAGSVVLDDVGDGITAVGVPAREIER